MDEVHALKSEVVSVEVANVAANRRRLQLRRFHSGQEESLGVGFPFTVGQSVNLPAKGD